MGEEGRRGGEAHFDRLADGQVEAIGDDGRVYALLQKLQALLQQRAAQHHHAGGAVPSRDVLQGSRVLVTPDCSPLLPTVLRNHFSVLDVLSRFVSALAVSLRCPAAGSGT